MAIKLISVTVPDSNGDCFIQYYSEDEWRITVEDNNKKNYVIISDVCNAYYFSTGMSIKAQQNYPFDAERNIDIDSLWSIINNSPCPGKMDHNELVKGNKVSCYSKFH